MLLCSSEDLKYFLPLRQFKGSKKINLCQFKKIMQGLNFEEAKAAIERVYKNIIALK